MESLTIVTSCFGYGKYLLPWARALTALTQRPGAVRIFTHGSDHDYLQGVQAAALLREAGFNIQHEHVRKKLDFGVARNHAVGMSRTEWVMHLDCDDQLMPHAVIDIAQLAPEADVVSLGYERAGETEHRPSNQRRLYRSDTGLEMLGHTAPCSGNSPFRRVLWERSPYRTDMRGAWDTALWIGFARLGARFRATKRPCFWYWHHADSVYNKRRLSWSWTHALVSSQLKSLRRNDAGVAIIVPRDPHPSPERVAAWAGLRKHYATAHPDWPVVEGTAPATGWVKGDAIEDALARASTPDVLIVADADCYVPPEALRWAVAQVQSGAPWAIPHQEVNRLTALATPVWLRHLATGTVPLPAEDCLARDPYQGYAGGGIFVVRRVFYEAVGGIPRVFEGWGSEDQALALILDTLVGKHVRGSADLIHFWHEPQLTKKTPAPNHRRYRSLRGAAMRGQDELWAVLQTFPQLRHQQKVRQASIWERREKRVTGVDLRSRNSYLARRRQAKLPPAPPPAAADEDAREDRAVGE